MRQPLPHRFMCPQRELTTRGAILLLAAAALLTSAPAAPAKISQLNGTAGCVDAGRGCTKARGLSFVVEVAASPDGRSLYARSDVPSGLATFARNTRTGALKQLAGRSGCIVRRPQRGCATDRTFGEIEQIVVSPDGRNVYTAGSRIVSYARNSRTGALRRIPPPANDAALGALAVSGDGRHLYVPTRTGLNVLVRDPASGRLTLGPPPVLTPPPAPGFEPAFDAAAAVSLDGTNVYVVREFGTGNAELLAFTRDAATGALSQVGPCFVANARAGCERARWGSANPGVRERFSVFDLLVAPDGRDLYVGLDVSFKGADHQSGKIVSFRRDAATGQLVPVGQQGSTIDSGTGISMSPDGRNVYYTTELTRGTIIEFDRAALTGGLRETQCVVRARSRRCATARGLRVPSDSVVTRDGRNLYVANNSGILAFHRR